MMRRVDRVPLLLALLAAGVLAAGCASSVPGESEQPSAARSEVDEGPVKLVVELEPSKATLAERMTLTVTASAEPGVKVVPPEFGNALGPLNITRVDQQLPRMEGERNVTEEVLTLEPTEVGRFRLPPIGVTFEQNGEESYLSAKRLTAEIVSNVPADASLSDVNAAAGPVEIPAIWLWVTMAAVVVVLAGAGLGGYLWYSNQQEKREEIVLTPKQIALAELDHLLHSELDQEDVKLFYVELTGIVRRYIERTSSVHAPEQTTEEFLREIASHPTFAAHDRERLQRFLESADLVKFAGYRPGEEAVHSSVDRARNFIDELDHSSRPEEVAAV
ncbi:hypothetical protein [Planctomycetes bacterium Pan216]